MIILMSHKLAGINPKSNSMYMELNKSCILFVLITNLDFSQIRCNPEMENV